MNLAGSIEIVEPGIAVRVHPALVVGQMLCRMLALSIDGELIPCRRWIIARPGPLVADIGPDTGGLCSALAGCLHLDRGVIRKDRLPALNMAPDRVGQRLQQCRRFANPVGQRRTIKVNAVSIEYLALPVERTVIGILRDQHMGQQARAGPPTLDRARWQGRLADRFAARASHAGPDKAVHHEPAGNIFQLFGDVLTECFQRTAACAAGVTS